MDYHWGIDRVKKRKHTGVDNTDTGEPEDPSMPGKKINNLLASVSDASMKVSSSGTFH